ncbi:MAG: hypothetical protein N4A33_04925 [Bacteriovoracaceae bacterium]|nr:hypothetical protein [Bacteriovoracaceae bacterium]
MKSISSLIIFFLLASCSLAPFGASKTGRTYGKNVTNFEMGNVGSNYYLKAANGLGENLDLGYFMEFGGFNSSGLSLKFSFLNQETGMASAMELLYGSLDDSRYTTIGNISSYNFGNGVEFFFNPRFNMVSTSDAHFDLGKSQGGVTLKSYEANYITIAYGTNLWFTSQVGFSFYGLSGFGSDIELPSMIFGGAILLNI